MVHIMENQSKENRKLQQSQPMTTEYGSLAQPDHCFSKGAYHLKIISLSTRDYKPLLGRLPIEQECEVSIMMLKNVLTSF